MPPAIRMAFWSLILVSTTEAVHAQHHGHGGGTGQGHAGGGPPTGLPLPGFAIGGGGFYGGTASYRPAGINIGGLAGGFVFGFTPGFLPMDQVGPGGLMLPMPAADLLLTQPQLTTTSSRRTGSSRADELTEVGDRSFRGKNYRRAEDRYQLAAKANRESPTPHIHLTQIAMIRGDYNAAAGHLREAVTAARGPGWLLEVPDIQAMYGEPGEFHRQIANLESFLQTHPDDRNGWFVLGAQHYFSGQYQAAADAFKRLSDQQPDAALVAFRDATTVASRSTTFNNNTFEPRPATRAD